MKGEKNGGAGKEKREGEIWVRPSEIYFSHDSIKSRFTCGIYFCL